MTERPAQLTLSPAYNDAGEARTKAMAEAAEAADDEVFAFEQACACVVASRMSCIVSPGHACLQGRRGQRPWQRRQELRMMRTSRSTPLQTRAASSCPPSSRSI